MENIPYKKILKTIKLDPNDLLIEIKNSLN